MKIPGHSAVQLGLIICTLLYCCHAVEQKCAAGEQCGQARRLASTGPPSLSQQLRSWNPHKLSEEDQAKLKQNKPAIDEADEGVRLDTILDTVVASDGSNWVHKKTRDALKVELLRWKRDQDLNRQGMWNH